MPQSDNYINEIPFPFEELLESSSIIFYHCELESGFPVRHMSSNVSEILGFDRTEFQSDDTLWLDRMHSEDRDRVLSLYNEIEDKKESVIEFRFKHKDGHNIWLRDEVRLVTDNQGTADSLVGTSIEITDQKQAEKELRQLNQTLEKRVGERTSKLKFANRKLKQQHQRLELLELAVDNINDMVIVTKAPNDNPLDSEIVFVNESFETFTGYSQEEVIGRQPTFLHGPETSQEVLNRINRQIRNHEPLREEFINYKKDGSSYWVELDMSPFPTDEENYKYWVGINRDITQRKKAEQKLEESEQRYRAFAELSFDAIFEINQYGVIKNCNKRATELFGYGREEFIGMPARKLIPDNKNDDYPEILTDLKGAGAAEAHERSYVKKDGSMLPAEIHTQTYQIGGENRLLAYIRDNTTHKSFEEKIQQSLKEKETLLSEIHHRVKNNLAIISGLLEMQAFNTDDDQLLAKLQEGQSRIQSIAMVHEKLYQSESFSEIGFDTYVDELIKMIESSLDDNAHEIRINQQLEPITLSVGQAIPCGLLLNELLTNCFKHAFPGQAEGTVNLRMTKNGSTIHLIVEDNGIGLPPDFNIAQESSLGMNLITTLVLQIEGDLKVSSDGGSRFEIQFEIEE